MVSEPFRTFWAEELLFGQGLLLRQSHQDHKNAISKELKRRLHSLKDVHVQGGKGTAYEWIELYRPGGFTPEERDEIKKRLLIDVGLTNCVPFADVCTLVALLCTVIAQLSANIAGGTDGFTIIVFWTGKCRTGN